MKKTNTAAQANVVADPVQAPPAPPTITRKRAITRTGSIEAAPSSATHPPADAIVAAATRVQSRPLEDPTLAVMAAQLADFEKFRIGCGNRLRIATRPADEVDEDGTCRGFGLSKDDPGVKALLAVSDGLEAVESGLVLEMKRRFRQHPLAEWVSGKPGLGEKTIARLLGAIGDPYWNGKHQRPRAVSELWAYCGLHGNNGHRAKGYTCSRCGESVPFGVKKETEHEGCGGTWKSKANWSSEAKMRTFTCIEPCIKLDGKPDKNGRKRAMSPYRKIYDEARAKVEDKLHLTPCARCGMKGKPAMVGTPWKDGHKHGHAMRIARKELLRDLWTEAKRLDEIAGGGQGEGDAHVSSAPAGT